MAHRSRILALALSLALTSALVGCAKKRVATTPAPPAPTPTETAPTPTPTPVPTPPSEPAAPSVAAKDLQIVYFAYDSFTLDDGARSALDSNAKLLRDNPGLNVSVDGHCDERGTVEYNQALGQKRADAVAQYLSDQGIDMSRLRVISYGKERPADEGHDDSAWAKNRRVEFSPR